MFATMYSTQAILPEISSDLDVSAAVAGLTVSVVVLAVALGGWGHGPLSDRIGRRRVVGASAGLLVGPTGLLRPSAGVGGLVALRILEGVLVAGLLVGGGPVINR